MRQLTLFAEAPAAVKDTPALRRQLHEAGYHTSVIGQRWPDGSEGLGKIVRCGERWVGMARERSEILALAVDDFHRHRR